ncbi:hypothetical protein [Vibrio diazotrophicus]|uniref:hypothetical protein n=1 Tax=Vibrio diazotrophicus TaxID=685 RepID=UPI000C9E6275|nr:hypothetical protein [Vibrio diazotrophicus]PNH87414.1 hypothetical protein C1M59_21480 [Vibrio diazotrophicus]
MSAKAHTNDWLALSNMDSRISVLPDNIQSVIKKAYEMRFSECGRTPQIREAAITTLELGVPFNREATNLVNATYRSAMRTIDNADAFDRFLCSSPLQIINALQRYGIIGLDYDYSRSQTTKNQASQAKWTSERERKMADICRQKFGGLPSCTVLRQEKSPELRGLPDHISSARARKEFAQRHGLILINKYRKNKLSKLELKRCYQQLCLTRGGYIPDSYLLNYDRVPIDDNGDIAGATLRSYIKGHWSSVRDLFLELADEDIRFSTWKYQTNTPTATDGTLFDSWNEVAYYEEMQRFIRQQHLEWSVIKHPIIGPDPDGYKSDLLIQNHANNSIIFIEVLMFNYEQIHEDKLTYMEKLQRRREAYADYRYNYLELEPRSLHDLDSLKSHFNLIEQQLTGGMCYSNQHEFHVSTDRPRGYWFSIENRDEAYQDVISRRTSCIGAFVSHRELEHNGYGGLTSHIKSYKIEIQTEAIRNHCFSFTAGNQSTNKRLPTREEMLRVVTHHYERQHYQRFTRDALFELFGSTATKYLIGRGRFFRTTEALNQYLEAVRVDND